MIRRPAGGMGIEAAVLATVLALGSGVGSAADLPADRYLRRLQMPGTADRFRQPLAVHADLHTGELFVCDKDNDRIAIFDAAGLFRYQIPGGASFRTPLDLAVDPEGYLLVLGIVQGRRGLVLLDFDGQPVREVLLTGLPAGIREPQPVSVAFAPEGDRFYLLDQANFRLWIADRQGKVVGSVDLVAGMSDKDAREQILGRVDAYGDTVLVALPMAGKVLLLNRDGKQRGAVGIKGTSPCQAAFPIAGALDDQGNVVILDQQRTLVMVWRPSDNRCLREISGIGSLPGYLYQPADLTLDEQGRITVSQGFDGRVQVFDGGVPAAGSGKRSGGP